MVIRLALTVSTMERAMFPRESSTNRFEVVPPGQAAMITSPTAMAGGTASNVASMKAMRGMTRIWAMVPTIIPFGYTATWRKSRIVRVMPIPIIMMNRAIGRPAEISGLDSTTPPDVFVFTATNR